MYLYGNGLLRDNQETVFCDGGGSVRRVTNAVQSNPYNVNYDSFGNVEAVSGTTANPLGFGAQSGYRNEGDLHLLLSGAREWDTMTGRFLTRDTDLSQSPYAYCDGDPVNKTDPTGHEDKKQDPPKPTDPPPPTQDVPVITSNGNGDGVSDSVGIGGQPAIGTLVNTQNTFKVTWGGVVLTTITTFNFAGTSSSSTSFGYNTGPVMITFTPMPGGGMLTLSGSSSLFGF